MTGADHPAEARWVMVARGATLRGARGRLTVRTAGGGASPLRAGQTVSLRKGGARREFRLSAAEAYRDRVILELEGIGSANEAEAWVGADIFLQSNDLVDLPEGTYYIFRLVGLRVVGPGESPIGTVLDVIRTGGTDLLLVEGKGGTEILIPFARAICRRVDPEAGIIEIDPPEGLLEIDAV